MSTTFVIKVNGDDRRLPAGTTLLGLLESLEINPGRVACEVNMDIVKRAEYAHAVLKEGDVVEIVQMIGGG